MRYYNSLNVYNKNKTSLIYILFFLFVCHFNSTAQNETDFNFDWKFTLEQVQNAEKPNFKDDNWSKINLPHDWSIKMPFDSTKEGCTAYLPGGIGWYRKHFTSKTTKNESVFILFDGIYNHSEVWINGNKLGYHPYGYTPFYYDLTPFLKNGQDNVIAVKVDHSRFIDSRWYPGSGIYRAVKMLQINKLHTPIWGTFVKNIDANKEKATIQIETTVENQFAQVQNFELSVSVIDPNGQVVEQYKRNEKVQQNGSEVFTNKISINKPNLWHVDNPKQYELLVEINQNGKKISSVKEKFGVKSVVFDKEKGFFLNGENMKIKGVCLHHDAGLVGSAVPKGVWQRRLQLLKDGGCNALRISHNPASQEFLDVCDEMGLLVQEEFFDEWDNPKDKRENTNEKHSDYLSRGYADFFQEWAESDLKTTVRAHRNHPSIFQWSIGNEIEWTYPEVQNATGFFNNMDWTGNYFWSQPPNSPQKIKELYEKQLPKKYEIGKTAQKLAQWTRSLDDSRPLIANCILPSGSFVTGYTDALDIVGFSYRRVMYDYARKNYPQKVVMGTESLTQWHEWKAVEEHPSVSGTFLWTGIDYLGEANKGWPSKTTASGLIDLAGFPRISYHLYKTLWSNQPHIYMATQALDKTKYQLNKNRELTDKNPDAWQQYLWVWSDVNEHWNYENNKDVVVEVISNYPKVELFLNDKSLGIRYQSDFPDRVYKWLVPFNAGNLKAVGYNLDAKIETEIKTASKAVGIKLTSDKTILKADNYDVSHIVAQLVDKDGNPVRFQEDKIYFETDGLVEVLGTDNGHSATVQRFNQNHQLSKNGKVLLIIQSKNKKGKTVIKARSESGAVSNSVEIGLD